MRRLRAVPTPAPTPAPSRKPAAYTVWPNDLPPSVDPMETHLRMQAQSILSGSIIGGGACPTLTLAQARDVMNWYRPL